MDSPPPRPATATAVLRKDPAGRWDLLECPHLLTAGGHGQVSYHSTGGLVRLPITFTSRHALVQLRPGRRTGSLPPPHPLATGTGTADRFSPRHVTRDPPSRSSGGEPT